MPGRNGHSGFRGSRFRGFGENKSVGGGEEVGIEGRCRRYVICSIKEILIDRIPGIPNPVKNMIIFFLIDLKILLRSSQHLL